MRASAATREPFLRPCDFPTGTPALVISFVMDEEEFIAREIDTEERILKKESAQRGFMAQLRRLALDLRMPAIWRELQRRRRNGGGYLYPARREYLCSLDPAWRTAPADRAQGMAMALLYGAALNPYTSFITKAGLEQHLDQKVRPHLEQAAQAREVRRWLVENDIADPFQMVRLDHFIAEYEGRARRMVNRTSFDIVIDRDRGDLKLRGYLAALAVEMLGLFGTASHRTLATIASVALDRKVTPAMAREARRLAVTKTEYEETDLRRKARGTADVLLKKPNARA